MKCIEEIRNSIHLGLFGDELHLNDQFNTVLELVEISKFLVSEFYREREKQMMLDEKMGPMPPKGLD